MKTTTEDQTSERPKRQYEAPAIEESGDFERLVLGCGHKPDDITNPSCDPGSPGGSQLS